jgi:hypothetical protein
VALAVVMAVALSACGQATPSPRAQVARYISQVNESEAALSAPLAAVTHVSAQVSAAQRSGLSPAAAQAWQRQLSTALAAIRVEGARLRAIGAPARGERLRTLVLRFTSAEADLTSQVRLLVVFLPQFESAVAPLAPALLRLEKALRVRRAAGASAVSAVYAQKVTALRRFQASADAIAKRLARLTPPAVSRPTLRAQLASLDGMAASAGRLAGALAGGHPSNVTPLLVEFDRAALATRTLSVQRAEIAAVRAYNARVQRLTGLADAIDRERLRLAESLH